MKKWTVLAAMLAGWAISGVATAQDQWKMAKGPLVTRWAKDVSPKNALPEYPRMQMVRKDWMNLNGLWQYAITPMDVVAAPANYDGQILVPYPVESQLSGVMKKLDEKSRLWYRRTFAIPANWAGKRVLLHFGAVDWDSTVWLNGKELGKHRGGYDGFSYDITGALKAGADQELIVGVTDPTDTGRQARGKQVLKPGGIMYTPSSGIWQTVWLEPVAPGAIDALTITPDVDNSKVQLAWTTRGAANAPDAEVLVTAAGQEVFRGNVKGTATISVPIPQPKLWSPDSPFLYDLKITLKDGNNELDSVSSYFGMRKIALGKDDKGITRILLNGKFVFQVGFLDQGFWPDGLYTAATDEALKYDIEITKKLGMNVARKHVKIEPDRWYYWCDKLGLLVWQDMAAGNNGTDESKKQYELELARLIDGRYNHPSIIMWVVFNEGWGQYDTPRLTQWVKQRDPSRLVNNASGWTDAKVGDVIDMHNYPGPGSPRPEEKRAAVLGEFGGLGLAIPEHTWSKESWGYKGMANQARLTQSYVGLLQRSLALKEDPGLCAVIYTQTTDVETECNGLLTYDRDIVKPDLEKVAQANQGNIPALPMPTIVVATSQKKGLPWRYTIEKPADDWFKKDFNAGAWKEGPGGFGTNGTPGAVVGTEWRTNDIWIRREFDMPAGTFTNLNLLLHHDEDAEVYINGVLAAKASGFVGDYEEVDISPEAKAVLKSGKNVIAVHCHQTNGGQFIDVGIVDVK